MFALHHHSISDSHGYSLKAITKTLFIKSGSDLSKPKWFTLNSYIPTFKTIRKWEKKAESPSFLWNQCQNKAGYNGQYLVKSIWKTAEHILEVRILIFSPGVAITFGSNFKGIFKVNTISVIGIMPLFMVPDYHVTNYYCLVPRIQKDYLKCRLIGLA